MENIRITESQAWFIRLACDFRNEILPLSNNALSDEIFAEDYGLSKQEISAEIDSLRAMLSKDTLSMTNNEPEEIAPIHLINSFDEIKLPNVKYAHNSNPTEWICIESRKDNRFTLHGMISGPHATYATGSNANLVKEWKTFKGVIKSLHLFAKQGAWGLSHWNQNQFKQ